jgi:hypothetical protein
MKISSIQDRFSTTLLIFGQASERTPQDLLVSKISTWTVMNTIEHSFHAQPKPHF